MTLKFNKCYFFTDTVDYLGHVIRPGKLEVASHTIDAIDGLNKPTTVTKLRLFLVFFNVFRRLVPNISIITSPLTNKLRKDEPATFDRIGKDKTEAFDSLKQRLMKLPVFGLPSLNGRYTTDTDASDKNIGCVLLQEQPEGTTQPIGYWSRTLTPSERAYGTTHRECLDVVWPVLLLRPYL